MKKKKGRMKDEATLDAIKFVGEILVWTLVIGENVEIGWQMRRERQDSL